MKAVIYTVQPGDSLSLISKKLYGDFSMVDKLAEMNKITNPNLIHPGQQLLVPDVPGAITSDAVVVDEDRPTITTSSSSTSSTSVWKSQVGKWFPWVIILGAAGLLYYESRKQHAKNKTSKKLNGLPSGTGEKAMEEYLISCIDSSGYDESTPTVESKVKFLWKTFNKEYDHAIKRYGERKAFKEWVAGLPSSFNIDFENFEILKIGKKFKLIPEKASDAVEDKFLENWFARVTESTFKLFNKYKVGGSLHGKSKTK